MIPADSAALPLNSVVIAGGTGFVGQRLVRRMVKQGVSVTVLTRSVSKARLPFGSRPVKVDVRACARGYTHHP